MRVSNAGGATDSATATITVSVPGSSGSVAIPPDITQHPEDHTIGPGETGPHTTGFLAVPKLRTGIVQRGGVGATRRYVGIAGSPRVAWAEVDSAHGLTQSIRVLDGFYVFALRRGSGQARVTERTLTGKRIRSFRLPR